MRAVRVTQYIVTNKHASRTRVKHIRVKHMRARHIRVTCARTKKGRVHQRETRACEARPQRATHRTVLKWRRRGRPVAVEAVAAVKCPPARARAARWLLPTRDGRAAGAPSRARLALHLKVGPRSVALARGRRRRAVPRRRAHDGANCAGHCVTTPRQRRTASELR